MRFHPIVFPVSAGVIVLFVLTGAIFNEQMGRFVDTLQTAIIGKFGWFYIASVAFFFLFVLWLWFSRYGTIRLGKDDDEPDYPYVTWFAMLFSAGMGIGLLFFSVAEPIMHMASPPRGGEPGSVEAARQAMTVTFFHWGLHAWAIYIIVALSLAYFGFRHDLPLSIRSSLYPLIGRHVHGAAGNVVDILAVFGTLFGLATSLGLGVMQVNAGLEYLGVLSISTTNQVILITVITLLATISVATGLDKGIRRLSELNLGLATILLAFVLLVGPTVFLLSAFVQNIGRYASSLVEMTFDTDAFLGVEWQKSWTMFYWAWWISWSPFVGMFIARVSRGRTIREFITGVLLVPTAMTFFWLTVFGNTGLQMELTNPGAISAAVNESVPTAVFVMLGELPWSAISAALTTAVVTIFFVTSSDSGSLVIDIITSGGHADPPLAQRIFWALTEGAVAAVLLVTGGLVALQTAAITTALPFAIVMIFICIGLVKGLRAEVSTPDPLTDIMRWLRGRPTSRTPVRASVTPATQPNLAAATAPTNGDWRQRMNRMLEQVSERRRTEPSYEKAEQTFRTFIDETVVPAFEQIKAELARHDRGADIERGPRDATLRVLRGEQEEFSYAIHAHIHHKMSFAFPEHGETDPNRTQMRAEVVLRSGRSQEYELREWTQEAIIEDFLRSYGRWMGW